MSNDNVAKTSQYDFGVYKKKPVSLLDAKAAPTLKSYYNDPLQNDLHIKGFRV
jgi:hypothetical protein